MQTSVRTDALPSAPPLPAEHGANEKLASGLQSSQFEANIWETQTLTPQMRWGNDDMHARYYNPNLGRFLSVDPIGGEVGSSQSWNRYSYVLNNPLKLVDTTGEYDVQAIRVSRWQDTHSSGGDFLYTIRFHSERNRLVGIRNYIIGKAGKIGRALKSASSVGALSKSGPWVGTPYKPKFYNPVETRMYRDLEGRLERNVEELTPAIAGGPPGGPYIYAHADLSEALSPWRVRVAAKMAGFSGELLERIVEAYSIERMLETAEQALEEERNAPTPADEKEEGSK